MTGDKVFELVIGNLLILCFLLLYILRILEKRIHEVYEYRMRIIDEDHEIFLEKINKVMLQNCNGDIEKFKVELKKIGDSSFNRYKSLPSYDWQLLMFWLPVEHWEKRFPVE